MSDSSRFLAYIQFFFGRLGNSGQTPELRQELWNELQQYSTSGAPHAQEVSGALMALLDKLDSEWDSGPARAGMTLYRALLDVWYAFSEKPESVADVVEHIEQRTRALVV